MNKESCQQAAQTPSSITVASGFSPVEVNAAFIASLVSHQQMVILINHSLIFILQKPGCVVWHKGPKQQQHQKKKKSIIPQRIKQKNISAAFDNIVKGVWLTKLF